MSKVKAIVIVKVLITLLYFCSKVKKQNIVLGGICEIAVYLLIVNCTCGPQQHPLWTFLLLRHCVPCGLFWSSTRCQYPQAKTPCIFVRLGHIQNFIFSAFHFLGVAILCGMKCQGTLGTFPQANPKYPAIWWCVVWPVFYRKTFFLTWCQQQIMNHMLQDVYFCA